jgi:hypothetical protein
VGSKAAPSRNRAVPRRPPSPSERPVCVDDRACPMNTVAAERFDRFDASVTAEDVSPGCGSGHICAPTLLLRYPNDVLVRRGRRARGVRARAEGELRGIDRGTHRYGHAPGDDHGVLHAAMRAGRGSGTSGPYCGKGGPFTDRRGSRILPRCAAFRNSSLSRHGSSPSRSSSRAPRPPARTDPEAAAPASPAPTVAATSREARCRRQPARDRCPCTPYPPVRWARRLRGS